MTRTALAALALVVAAGGARAAEDVELEQTIRAASRLEAIARVCPALMPTDAGRARTYASAYISVAEKVAGSRLNQMMPAEMKRRIAEIEITGDQRWCEDQRRFMKEVGADEIFPIARPRRR